MHSAYQISIAAANWKKVTRDMASEVSSRYLSSPLSYVRRHITVNIKKSFFFVFVCIIYCNMFNANVCFSCHGYIFCSP